MNKKIIYWVIGILLVLGIFGAIGSSSNPQAQGINTSVIEKPTTIPIATLSPSTTPQAYLTPIPTTTQSTGLSNDNTYTNVDGNQIHSPAYSNSGDVPAGATAQCGDGTYSFSQHRSGTCSHHGGVSQWL